MVLLVIVAIIAAVSSANKPGAGSRSHPASADVTVKTCTVDPTLGLPQATGLIVNHSTGRSDYTFTVQFLKGGVQVAQGTGLENDILPHQTAQWSAEGDNQVTGAVTCQITGVIRLAAP